MSETTSAETDVVPAIEGWLVLGDDPHLIGTRCSISGSYFFPPERTMSRAPGCSDATLSEVPLSTAGTLWSYTNAGYRPPEPFVPRSDPFVPFCIAAVELATEGIVVLGQCPAGVSIDDLHVGMDMELTIEELDQTGDEQLMIWKWQPVGWTERSAS